MHHIVSLLVYSQISFEIIVHISAVNTLAYYIKFDITTSLFQENLAAHAATHEVLSHLVLASRWGKRGLGHRPALGLLYTF
jgi:hypothetical protein